MSSKSLSEELKNKESQLRSNFEMRVSLASTYNASKETLDEIYSDYQRNLGSVRTIYKNLVDLALEVEDKKEKKIKGYKSDTLIYDDLPTSSKEVSSEIKRAFDRWLKLNPDVTKLHTGFWDPAFNPSSDGIHPYSKPKESSPINRKLLDYIIEKGYKFSLVCHESKQGFNYREYYEKISEIEKYIDHPDPNKRISGVLRDDFKIPNDPNLYLHSSYSHYNSYFGGFNLDSLLGAYFIPNVYEIFNISPSEFHNLKNPLNPTSDLKCFYVPIKEENFNKILFNLDSCLSMLKSEVDSSSKERLRYNLLALSDLLKFGRFFDLVLKVSFNP